jgi:hypothetical protein
MDVVFIENGRDCEAVIARISDTPIIPEKGEILYFREALTQRSTGKYVVLRRDFVINTTGTAGTLNGTDVIRRVEIHVAKF